MSANPLSEKLNSLKTYLQQTKTVAIAFSSGVDSTFLLKVAHDVLKENAIAITVNSCFIPESELQEAKDFCNTHKIKHIICNINPLEIPGVSQNPKNRCYLCKKAIFSRIIQIASENGINTVCEGSNLDDLGDYRPGLQAIAELGIKSPLKDYQFTKSDIRLLSKDLNLPTWEKPSYACLASRFVYGDEITESKLKMVEKAEKLLIETGFKQMRVRIHGTIARIEVLEKDFELLLQNRKNITESFKNLGFSYITMDLQGFRTGSMNETIIKQ